MYDALAYRNFIGNASVPLLRRAVVEEVGGYDPSPKARGGEGCEDRDLPPRIAEKHDVRLVPAYLSGYRAVTDSMSDNTASMARSFNLVIQRAEQSSCDVPPHFLRWARANFYRYLAAQSYNAGHFETALRWLRASVRQDPTAMLSSWILKTAFKSAVRSLASPATSLVWEGHEDWLAFKSHFVLDLSDPPSIDQLQYRPETVAESWGPRWWKPHDQIRAYRWRRTKERCGF